MKRKQDIYYQKISNLAKAMREWHSFVKSMIIYTYCSPKYINKSQKKIKLNVFDIGVGRGGDIMKFYHARVNNLVGIDVDNNGINSSTDGAVSRYTTLKKKFPDFTKMTFIHADGGALLNLESQLKVLGNMNNENKELIENTFKKSKQFDIINCQMAFHYFFENNLKLDNICTNINHNLKPGGFVINFI